MSAVLKPSKSKSVKERVSKEEWDLRVDLAAAYQLAAIFKWTDLIYTHFSARLLGHDEFLINPYGLMFEEITASNLIKIDHDGKVGALRDAVGFLERLREDLRLRKIGDVDAGGEVDAQVPLFLADAVFN